MPCARKSQYSGPSVVKSTCTIRPSSSRRTNHSQYSSCCRCWAQTTLRDGVRPYGTGRRTSAVRQRRSSACSSPSYHFVRALGNASQAIAFCGTAPLAWGRRNRPPSSAAIAALSSSDRPSQASQPSAKAFFKAGRRSKSSTKPGGCSIVMSACPERPPPTTRAGARDPRHPRRGSWSGRRGALGDSNHGEKRGLLLDSRPKAFH